MIRIPKLKFRLSPGIIAVLAIILGITTYFSEITFLEIMDLKTVDLRFAARGTIAPTDHVVLATIDEKSLEKEGKWMWPRFKFADLIKALDNLGAKVIAFDIGFLEKDNPQLLKTLHSIKEYAHNAMIGGPEFKAYLDQLHEKSDNDRLLVEAIRKAKARIVLGHFFILEKELAQIHKVSDHQRESVNLANGRFKIVAFAANAQTGMQIRQGYIAQANIAPIAEVAPFAGYFNMLSDIDGVFRRMPMVLQYQEELYAPLSLMAVSAFLDKPLTLFISEIGGVESIRVGDIQIPTDDMGHSTINYRGPDKTFPHHPVTDILNGRIDAHNIKNKIVFIGTTATAAHDMRVTPVGGVFPGVEIHANVADSILAQDFLYQPPWEIVFDILAIIAVTGLLYFALPRLGVLWGLGVTSALFVGYVYFCIYLFSARGWILNMVFSLVVVAGVYVTITAYRYFNETRQKRFIRDAFSTYVAPTVVKQLLESPDPLELGGEERQITAFFSDVVAFTTIAEKLSPKAVVELLNQFLTEMTDIILTHMGTVDKFEGDAIIALFGAPNELPNKALSACKACIEMDQRLVELRQQWRKEGKPPLFMRIGMATGPAVVGNMGSRNRMDYTMMGDTVNTASRLEQANKLYGSRMLINHATYQEAGPEIAFREVDRVLLYGKSEAVTLYEILGYKEALKSDIMEGANLYAKGLAAYRDSDWERAAYFFNQTLQSMPNDGPSQTLLKRIDQFKKTPPPAEWKGAIRLTSK